MTMTAGSAADVTIERASGTLQGKMLQHSGVTDRGAQQRAIHVAPDPATGELAGLRGSMGIRIAEGGHHHDFEFTLPA